jgi:hypothetical protein
MSALETIQLVWSLGVLLMALVGGRIPERMAAIIFAINTAATAGANFLWGFRNIGNLLLTFDGLMALCFLVLAIRYNYLWVALLMGSMSGYFGVHAFYLMTNRPLDETFALMNNLATGVALLSLTIGVWTSRHRKDEWH